jgi:hypothetical protein
MRDRIVKLFFHYRSSTKARRLEDVEQSSIFADTAALTVLRDAGPKSRSFNAPCRQYAATDWVYLGSLQDSVKRGLPLVLLDRTARRAATWIEWKDGR